MSETTICINYAIGKLSHGLHTHTALSKAVVERYLNFFYSNFDAIIHKPLLCYPPVVSIYIKVPNYSIIILFSRS